MLEFLFAGALAAGLNTYPAFGDRVPLPRSRDRSARVEAVIDKGLIVELIVACPTGTAIVSYSKVERLYCGPGGGCSREPATALARACR